jgi:hypothetical protein
MIEFIASLGITVASCLLTLKYSAKLSKVEAEVAKFDVDLANGTAAVSAFVARIKAVL